MRFRVHIDAEIEADNIDAALALLGSHYTELGSGNFDTETIFVAGEANIEPITAAYATPAAPDSPAS